MFPRYPQRLGRRIITGFLSSAFFITCFVQTTTAQTDYAKLTVVVVKDDTKSPAKDVVVILLGGQKESRTCTTNDDGLCVFAALIPLTYEIRVSSKNLDKAVSPSGLIVELMPGQNAVRQFREGEAAPGALITAPQKTAPNELPLVEGLVVGRQGERASSSQLDDLPNSDQSERALVQRQPGVFSSGAATLGGFIFNGQPGTQNVIQEAGVNSTVIVRSSASFQDTNALVFDVKDRQSIKKYKSFAVDTNNTPAKFGTGTGGQLIEDITSGDPKKFSGEVYEYFANDVLSARNFFDFARKPSLRFNLFGISVGGPLITDRLMAFFNYEGIRASSGNTIFAAAPKLSLESTADEAVAPLIRSFRASGASVIQGASGDPNYDIIELEGKNIAKRNGITLRLDYLLSKRDTFGFIYLGSRARGNVPDGASGRRSLSLDNSHKAVFDYQRTLTADSGGVAKLKNQFIFGLIDEPSQLFSRLDDHTHTSLFASAVSIEDEVAQSSISGQPLSLGIATAGGLLGGDFTGRRLRLIPRQFSFIDQMTWSGKAHNFTFGGEVRLLRTSIDQLFGTTYKFATLSDFLANRSEIKYVGDLGSLTANPGERNADQEYYIAFFQDAWKIHSNLLLTYGLRYEYYTPLREEQQSVINIDPATGLSVPAGNDLYKSRKNNFLPRIAVAWAPNWDGRQYPMEYGPLVFSGSFGMHVGPDVFDNILRPVTNNQLRLSGDNLAFPINLPMLAANNAQNAQFTPIALSRDYTSPSRVYKFDFTVKKELVKRSSFDEKAKIFEEAFLNISYVGNRSRHLLLRNFANRIVSVETNPNPELDAIVRREFDIVSGGELLHPFGEFEFLTTGGRSSFDSFQVAVKGRTKYRIKMFQLDYTLARNRGNTDGDDAIPTGNPLDYDYDFGYNALDVRHKFSFTFLLDVPCLSCKRSNSRSLNRLLDGWSIASTGFYQTGAPIDIRLDRPDVVYIDQMGKVFSKPGLGRHATLNVPGGGSSVVAYRPNLIAGANPYLENDRNFLNPEAFSIPAPGQLGNLSRGAIRAPRIRLVDLSIQKVIKLDKKEPEDGRTLTFNMDVTNLFNFTNFKLPSAKLPDVLGTNATDHQLQPNQPFTAEAASNFGVLKNTFKRKSDLGSSRQIQFGVSLKF